jgi:hypothetical protein
MPFHAARTVPDRQYNAVQDAISATKAFKNHNIVMILFLDK